MGWKDDLQDASFRGVQFECTSTNESGSKSLAVKQPPYSNKASVEDMGNNPLKISIDAVFSGENYKIEMDALWAALVATGSGELIHPIHGVMQVYAESYQIGHVAEEVDACKISIEFIQAEDKERPLFIPIAVPVSIPLYSIPDSPVSALQSVLKKLQQFNPNKFFSFVNKIRDGISAARQFLGTVKGAIENVLSPDWIVGLIDDATRLATFDTNISAISKWRDVFKRIQRFEKLFQNDDDTPKVMQQTWRAVQVYDQFGHQVLLHQDGIKMTGNVEIVGGLKVSENIESEGEVSDKTGSMQQMRVTYNIHLHGSSPPAAPPME
ncbi:DNA circularization N-terminal domain-containing protein [Acinetobacter corruptisaponis]|uniref:DNA circularization N-terminal domain-containing protein n=1 Tax=Acinetobacter corruptisaponis TaxID=3045147 RepID=A0ABY8RZQ2_9GAMM|nr:DNA circularization N-terminal domain-containing protein [Acinetobacter sp. KCTC 92772]WHP04772.1 DNA circularization N-terminal domain-containing protein [Acinetobacter sp. KCTC 92772]